MKIKPNHPTKEQLYQAYIVERKSIPLLVGEFHFTGETIKALIEHYGILKTPEQNKADANYRRLLAFKENKRSYAYQCSVVTKEILYKYYIEEDHNYYETIEHFDITEDTFRRMLKDYEIPQKDKSKTCYKGIATKYEKAGGKENYDKHMVATQQATLEQKFGSLEEAYKHVSDQCKKTWGQKPQSEIDELNERRHKTYFDVPEKIENAKKKRKETNINLYGIPNTFEFATSSDAISVVNKHISDLLNANNIEHTMERSITTDYAYRYDIVLTNTKTCIEINPWPHHNTTFNPRGWGVIDKNYHKIKTQVAREAGYRCINIWDWDSAREIIRLTMLPRERIYARKCSVKEIKDKKSVAEFINNYHLQGNVPASIAYGLYYNDELVSVMTFGKPRYNKKFEYELIRYCSSKQIVGGAAKLFNHFITDYSPKSVVSYCDYSKFDGHTYTNIGMKLEDVTVSKHWYNIKTGKHILDSSLRAKGFDILLGDIYGCYGKGARNDELMRQHDFVEIYDAGQARYSWYNN